MTLQEAVELECRCAELFCKLGPQTEICRTIGAKLQLRFQSMLNPTRYTSSITFDQKTGEPLFIEFCGLPKRLRKGLSAIRKVCAVPENVKMLSDLKWAYEHMEDLPDEDDKDA